MSFRIAPPSGLAGRTARTWGLAGIALAVLLTASPAWAIRCLMPDLEQYRNTGRPVPSPAQMVPTHTQPGDPMTPPDVIEVGSQWLWYTWHFAGGPPHYHQVMCTVRGIGANVYVVVENSQWGTNVDQTDVNNVIAAWDNHSYGQWPTQGLYQLDTETFGPAPDMLDNDPKIFALLYDFDVSNDGFFWAFDEYPDGWDPTYRSNECEVIYVDSSTPDPGGPGGAYLTAVMSHEFTHMIHWYADENEVSWLTEATAELAMWLYGRPDDISGFNAAPDNSLTSFSGNYPDYVKVYLWCLYLYEHFGGQATIQDMVARTTTSWLSVQQTLQAMGYNITFGQEVADWTTANYLDNPDLDGGRWNYAGDQLPAFAAITRNAYPVPVTTTAVSHFAADYVKFINGVPQRLNFDGGDTSDWSVRIIKYLSGAPLSVTDMTLDGADAGSIDLAGFGTQYDQVVMCVANTSNAGLTSYQYSTTSIPVGVEELPLAGGLRLIETGANPFASGTTLRLLLDRPSDIRASIHDVRGGVVRSLASGMLPAGAHELSWDGRDASGRPVSSGVYFLNARSADGRGETRKLVLER